MARVSRIVPTNAHRGKAAEIVRETFEEGSERIHEALADSSLFRSALLEHVFEVLSGLADRVHDARPKIDRDEAFLAEVDYIRQCEPWFPRAVKCAFELAGIPHAALFRKPRHLPDDLAQAADDASLHALRTQASSMLELVIGTEACSATEASVSSGQSQRSSGGAGQTPPQLSWRVATATEKRDRALRCARGQHLSKRERARRLAAQFQDHGEAVDAKDDKVRIRFENAVNSWLNRQERSKEPTSRVFWAELTGCAPPSTDV